MFVFVPLVINMREFNRLEDSFIHIELQVKRDDLHDGWRRALPSHEQPDLRQHHERPVVGVPTFSCRVSDDVWENWSAPLVLRSSVVSRVRVGFVSVTPGLGDGPYLQILEQPKQLRFQTSGLIISSSVMSQTLSVMTSFS
ncbi:hypothetical protein F2P81_008514 [Scophthalmus maximus]|uniref:Uncharacterized protein n=1 Tax=Scophthalmus maximus TaxID=52904 RepID=A0A6A4T5S9_SCOMX|nr:hypothetical protein F2P81_008514 [Scophthalmus maximus]